MSILNKASLVVTPTAYKEDKLYSIVPKDGSGDLTWIRATDATRINKEGLIERTPYNLFSYSEQFDIGIWNKTSITITTNNSTAPNNLITADLITPTNADSYLRQVSLGALTNELYTASVYLKSATGANIFTSIRLRDVNSGAQQLENIIITTEWQRFTVTFSVPSGANMQFWLGGSSTLSTGENLYMWGAQLVEGDEPKQYLPTINRQDVPRITYTTTGGTPSILIEPQRTNLLTYSEQFDNINWHKTRSNITTNVTTSPNGTMTADKFFVNTDNNTHRIEQTINSIPGSTYTASFFYKLAELTGANLKVEGYAGSELIINFTANTVVNNFNVLRSSIENYNNGWYRVSATWIINATSFRPAIEVGPTIVDGVSGVYIWGFQTELGATHTSYIPTTTSTVTRNADVVEKTNISDLIGQTEGTLFVDFNYEKNDPNDNFVAILSDNSSNNGVWIDVNNSNTFVAIIRTGGNSSVYFTLSAANFQFGRKKIAFSYKSGATSLYINGVKIGLTNTNAFTFNNTVSKFNLGCFWNNSSYLLNNTINSSAIFKQALTDAECTTLTTL